MAEELIDVTEENGLLAPRKLSSRINQRSELSQEIVSRRPDFIERWALFIFSMLFLLMLVATWFIRYPDIIETNAMLTAANAPKEIISRQDGRLVRLFIHNNEQVSPNEVIGWLESTASHEDVLALSRQLDSSISLFNSRRAEEVAGLFNRPYFNLGEIQTGYQQFIVAWQQFNDYIINGFYSRKMRLLKDDIRSLDSTKQTIYSQKELSEQDVKLAEETYNMNNLLLSEKVLSNEEYRVEKSKYVTKKMAIPQLKASLLSIESQKRDKLRELDELAHDLAQQKIVFQQAIQSLKSQVDEWRKKYVLQSPVAGKVAFIIPLQENQYLKAGRLLGYINPDDSHFYAETNLPQDNFGKVDTGLKVQLRFLAYPYQEVGIVDGTLSYISNVPSDSGFLATIRLNNGLVTNIHKPISYRNGLQARAIIITKDMRLLERLYYNMVKSTFIGSK